MKNIAFTGAMLLACILAACSGGSPDQAGISASAGSTVAAESSALPSSTFTFVGSKSVAVADCPGATGQTATWCNSNWPPDLRGTVFQYTFTETRLVASTYPTLTRTAYVYKPLLVLPIASYPMLVYLHGATQSGDQMFQQLSFAQLADGRSSANSIFWLKNSSTCKQSAAGPASFGLGGTSSTGFVDVNGNECTPSSAKYSLGLTANPFYVVYPNGIPDFDKGGDSWEDGRNPSPGQFDAPNPNVQKRDDVGFINAVIATVKAREGRQIDSSRVYIGGLSNGGVMSHRLLCNTDNTYYPELGLVAAYAISVASMADNIYNGTNGREACPATGTTLMPLAIFVGYGSPTPNSNGQTFYANCNPYNPSNPRYPRYPACPYPTVSGDSVMPYGTGLNVGGGTFTVNSPTIGNVIASPDDQKFWLHYLTSSGAGSSAVTNTTLGYFTQLRRYTFSSSPAVLQIYQVDHGLHLNGGTRNDYSAAARIYDFLFEFKRANGTLATTGGTYDPASGTYGNLNGSY